MEEIEGVAGAGEIQVEARIFRPEAVIGLIIDPAEAERRTHVVAFRGVVVDDVENHFDPGGVKVAHHAFELGHLPAERAA